MQHHKYFSFKNPIETCPSTNNDLADYFTNIKNPSMDYSWKGIKYWLRIRI